jgi:hypothetical protein
MIFRATKTAAKTQTGRKAGKLGVRAAAKAGKGVGKTALKAGKAEAKLARQALSTREAAGARYLKYGFFALAGFTVGALVARSREKEVGSSTWGSGTASDPASPAAHQRPQDPNRTGPEREYSDPSSGPLIGRRHQAQADRVPEQQEDVEQRIRTRIGEDPRTINLPRINVEVNDGVAELRGPAPSEDVKEAAGEIAANIEGVREVRNLLTVDPQSPIRTDKAAGGEPDQTSS